MTLDELFERKPRQWGLRGDPHLWRELRERFRGQPIPDDFEWSRMLEGAVLELLGITRTELSCAKANDVIGVERYVTGSGLSDGSVSTHWWRWTGIPILLDRADAIRPPDVGWSPGNTAR